MFDFPIHPLTYEQYLIAFCGVSREEAKNIVDEMYFKQYGISREKQVKETDLENIKWESKKFDYNRQ